MEKFGENVTKAIKRIRPENFSLKGCRRGGGVLSEIFFATEMSVEHSLLVGQNKLTPPQP